MRRARENGFKRSADFYDTFAGFVGKDETVAEHFSKDGQIDYIELGRMREGSPVTNAEITMKP